MRSNRKSYCNRTHRRRSAIQPVQPLPLHEQLMAAGAQLQELYDAMPVALGAIGRDGCYLVANAAYATIHGMSPSSLIGRPVARCLPDAQERVEEDFRAFDDGIQTIERELECRGRYYLASLKPLRGLDGKVTAMTIALVDITSRKRLERSLERSNRHWRFRANHDHLTGLPNRRFVDRTIVAELRQCARTGAPVSVLMIDVDYFKNYNDHVGHQRGDDCLRAIATRLNARVKRPLDTIGRYGGEEFILILPATDAGTARQMADAALDAVRDLAIAHPASPYGHVTLSIGVATLEDATGDALQRCDELLSHADRALYSAKAVGRNTAFASLSRLPITD
ncbi:MAG TPA: GGDEF domain-containing protein [Dyella sp.]|uniref:sensor domain-containing diguanylate cyclase n=1 Tax=Dyella sp. TaxID=1869338 RepID=UPI002F923A2A